MTVPVAGWYNDPQDPRLFRWWDGSAWTDNVHDPEKPGSMFSQPFEQEPVVPEAAHLTEQEPASYDDADVPVADARDAGDDPLPFGEDSPAERTGTAAAGAAGGRDGAFDNHDADGASRRWSLRTMVVALVGLLLLAVGGTAAAFVLLSGAGPQPEDAMPADTVAFAKIDLNPDADQKINLARFITTVLPADVRQDVSSDDPLGDLVATSGMLDGSGISWEDIRAWLGDRAAIAVAPASLQDTGSDLPPVYFLISVTDETAFTSFMDEHATRDMFYGIGPDGYAVLAPTQRLVDYVVNAESRLPESADYQGAVSQVGTGQVFVAYADLAGMQAFTEEASALVSQQTNMLGLPDASDLPQVSGSVIVSTRIEPTAIDLAIATYGYTADGQSIATPVIVNDDLGTLPSTVAAGLTVAGLGQAIEAQPAQAADLRSLVEDGGVAWDDLMTLLSSTITVAVIDNGGDTPAVAVRVTRSDAMTPEFMSGLLDRLGLPAATEQTDTHIYLSDTTENLAPFLRDGERLADTETYQTAIGGDPGAVNGFADLSALWAWAQRNDPTAETFPQVTGTGFTAQGSETPGSATVHIRVLFQPAGD